MKVLLHLIAIAILGAGWGYFFNMRSGADDRAAAARELAMQGDFERADEAEAAARKQEDEAAFTGILLAFLTAGYAGLMVVAYVLPALAHKFTHTIYDSGEMVEEDAMHGARALVAQGEYEAAIEAFHEAAEADPGNRVPWVEMARLKRDQLQDAAGAAEVLREALENHEWEENDAAFLLFRLAETYHDHVGDKEAGAEVMRQVIEQFPGSRHSANARHRLQEWGMA